MKVFVAGGSGAIGRRLVPLLVRRGHAVVATTRSGARTAELEAAGATPVTLDVLDEEAVRAAVAAAEPDVVVHQATALSGATSLRKLDRSFAATNRLRTEGTRNLLQATVAAGSRRFVAQSFTGWPNVREGGPVKTEDDPLDPDPPAAARETLAAIRTLEQMVAGAAGIEGVVLRYGILYGPGTGLAPGGAQLEAVRRGRFPVVGDGTGVWSFVHVDDAAAATALAVEEGPGGVFNVVDDEPAPVSEWLPALAKAVGGPRPRRIPVPVARLVLGEQGVAMMTESRGSSNAKAKRVLGWQPAYATWREGFRSGLSEPAPAGTGARAA